MSVQNVLCVNVFCVILVDRMRRHIRGLVPCDSMWLSIYEFVHLLMTAELTMLQISKEKSVESLQVNTHSYTVKCDLH